MTKILSFSCVEKLPALLDWMENKKPWQTIRPAWDALGGLTQLTEDGGDGGKRQILVEEILDLMSSGIKEENNSRRLRENDG